MGAPPHVGHDRDTAQEPRFAEIESWAGEQWLGPAFDDEGIAYARLGLDLVEIGAHDRASENGALLERRPEHPRRSDVDAVERFAGDDGRVVDPGDRGADDLVVFRSLQRDRCQVRRRQRRRRRRQFTIAQRPVGGSVLHATRRGAALGLGYPPRLRGCRDQHLSAGCASPAQWVPVGWRRGAAPGPLSAVGRLVEIRLLDPDVLPVDIELLCDQHRQHRLDALADLWILGHDRQATVCGEMDKAVWHERGRPGGLAERLGERIEIGGQDEPSAGHGTDAQKAAAIDTNGGSHTASLRAWSAPSFRGGLARAA